MIDIIPPIGPTTYRPDTAVPPGATILDLLAEMQGQSPDGPGPPNTPDTFPRDPANMDGSPFCQAVGLDPGDFVGLIDGRVAITHDLASRLSEYFAGAGLANIPAYVWVNLEGNYREAVGRLAAAKGSGTP